MNSDVRYYLGMVRRRLFLILLVFILGSVASVMIALKLPTVYRSSAVLLVESAQIPGELAFSTVQTNASEQLEVIEQRLLTRANLIDIANSFDVFSDLEDLSPDEVVTGMEQRTRIDKSSGQNRATLMVISFEAEKPDVSASVANQYVTLVLNENVRYRQNRAEQTEDFFVQEVDRLAADLEIQSARILEYKTRNSSALPESYEFRLTRLATLQERQAEYQRERIALAEQRDRLRATDDETFAQTIGQPVARTPQERKLLELRDDLAEASAIYSETNPRIRILKSRIAQLEEVVQSINPDAVTVDTEERIATLIGQIETQLSFIDTEMELINAEISELEETIQATPTISIELDSLERDYENVQQQYNSAVDRLAMAQTGERIELLSKGERITVIEQAVTPSEPTSPNRPVIAAGGSLAALGAGLGLALLLELTNKAVRRPKDLINGLGITPLATLPVITTVRGRRRRRLLIASLAILIIGVISGAVYAVQEYYLPLDLLAERVLDKIGV